MKILISRTDKIGDVVCTLPLAGALKAWQPACRVGFLCSAHVQPLVAVCANVDEIIVREELEAAGLDRAAERLKKAGFDAVVHVFPVPWIARLCSRARIPLRIGTLRRWYHWLTCNRRVMVKRSGSRLHEAQLNLLLLAPIIGPAGFPLKSIPLLYGLTRVPELHPTLAKCIDPARFNLVLHPGSRGSAPVWPMEHFVDLAARLPSERFNVVLSGNGHEREQIRTAFGVAACRLLPETDLSGLISFIAASDGFVASSTGPAHIAAALGRRVLGIHTDRPPTHPGRWAPVGSRASTVSAPDPADISVEQVLAVIIAWDKKGPQRL
ncbi:MAG: hypothetical protein A2268_16260 [Candidatus Raymondbacteria bacterium RifOxyA12_full_50_37]|uniref:Glycosyl transferase family 9 n=1 Tax=Candidatus Raymondbacteria bacterium RIFOXYD12_FULL_49_13 TaxID=1817890 RepID=A0A1F7F861_UNCRA|nr:MAG: hypothetical protein A2268_16260 [Candidatus Raymondbacteria bacterium RifOxyA12_full_50_37]OGJ94351.1 MAG: hypothetical protein A2248_14455 [Candidatus Raymondbacteria bacterium RIFOXYA2_FULL_49_16]OGJ95293.1 MAG: hypothetical protein A2453_05880 [Candidatus Raymondbacteria bacterium RIFOXYC2_FULL_50_21]OGJ99819.1 MAG: hypothetical protein A2487_10810 [Candidatus Raymondbacteria bacterium RifOxyC12_full_50_8]OGK02768.1 MAG: hypothetical protein A2519_07450 [Candidatus Raymondbacteria b